MPTQTWKVVVTKLGGSELLGEVEIVASNWMGALRAGRERLGEPAGLPAGASCTVDSDGVATVLDPAGRRKLVLSPLGDIIGPTDPPPGQVSHPVSAPVAPPPQAAAPEPAAPADAPAKKRKRFETVAFMPGQMALGPAVPVGTPGPVSPAPEAPAVQSEQATTPVATQDAPPKPAEAHVSAATAAVAASPVATRSSTPSGLRAPAVALEVLFERSEEASAQNPLCYRERAYYAPRNMQVPEAEAALRFELAAMQASIVDRPRGKLVNLAAFDHRWSEVPNRPPIVSLQWRDWRGEVSVDYPAVRLSSLPPSAAASEAPPAHDERLDEVFQGLAELGRMTTPVEGLDLAVRLLAGTVPAEASAACLYDINTDELRFVSVAGVGADARQGRAVACSLGLTGQALRDESRPSVFRDVILQAAFVPDVDAPGEIDARNLLVSPIAHDGHLLGAIQLVNRRDAAGFSRADANVVGYLAERLGEFLRLSRQQLEAAQRNAR